jgi:hypothetical protein
MLCRGKGNTVEIARHSHLVHAKNGSGHRADGCLDEIGIDVEGVRIYVHEYRDCLAVTNAVGGCDIRMADSDHFVPRTDARSKQGQMQCRSAT